MKRFHLNFATADEAEECHHPAWNIEGDQIMCHWDVTAAIEEAEGVSDEDRGSWRGIFGTCSSIHGNDTWSPAAG